jgi:hypothetical protein
LADKSTQLVLEALSRAVADPAGLPLYAGKSSPGLFAPTAPARLAAQRCKDDGYLRVLHSESRGKVVHEICSITEKGLAYLLDQASPKQVLEDLVRAVEARRTQVSELVSSARQSQASLELLKAIVEKVLTQFQSPGAHSSGLNGDTRPPERNGSETWTSALLSQLAQWHASGASGDCPLPEVYRRVQRLAQSLTVGQFHDGLRQLHQHEQIYLHPWTGPLHELPEPLYALLIGHEIAYYASLRKG